ncbi:MAG: DUF523 and DUF1722 domain-containing protein [Deferribacteres bacterium]|nr:DUF523 and DUF1722 domain-containing protein [candidate division KSB1 bacterium]MCB9509878.1 DUF523 and DUF1722 domain-containing protein [Deferribacteres bacterium]
MNQTFPRPVVVTSKCLEFDACRFNGQVISDSFVRGLKQHVHFIMVCPEVEIGLGTPREPIRLVGRGEALSLVQPATDRDVTAEMQSFSQTFLGNLPDVDGFILKSRSPSCGPKDVRIYSEKGMPMASGSGLFAQAVLDNFPGLAIEDEGRLRNFRIREHYLTKLFALARFREVQATKSMRALVHYQTTNKLIFMAYNQASMRRLGQIVANAEKNPIETVMEAYKNELTNTFSRIPKIGSNINVLMHALGYFSKKLSSREKAFFLDELEKYRQMKVPLSAILNVLSAWIARFDEKYLSKQTFFEPYPLALLEISDSGKGREL